MKNKYYVNGDKVYIELNRKDGSVYETIIDIEDLHLMDDFLGTWFVGKSSHSDSLYAKGFIQLGRGQQREIQLHRYLFGEPKGKVIDHINRDTLDNTRSNLRVVTIQENSQNRTVNKNSKSGMIGVLWDNETSKWRVQLTYKGKRMSFGRYDNLVDAGRASNKARMKYLPLTVQRKAIKLG